LFTYDDDKFVEEIQSRDHVFYQCVEIINEKISRILWASKTLLGFSDDFYKVKTEVNFNYSNFRSTYSILSAVFRYRLNRLSLFEDDIEKIEARWKNWIRTEINNWFDDDPRFIKTLLRFSNETNLNIYILNGRLLDKYNEVPWDQNILNENKLNHNYEFINEDDNDFEEEEDLGPYCICSTKNRSPCTVLPCITLAEESAKKGIFLE
jgi:hypothetical protein